MTKNNVALPAKIWVIDPECESITRIQDSYLNSLILETVGADAECLKLDNYDNVIWVSNTDSNERYGFYFEMMGYPLCVRRYSCALLVSLGPNYWSDQTILGYLRFVDKQNVWGDV